MLKADSEGRVGPSDLQPHPRRRGERCRARAASRMAACSSIAASSTTITWIGSNPKNDRARAAYDNFHDLDGKFDDNVIVQIKNGPIDFQVREPASPLFGALPKDQASDRAANHAGIFRPGAPHGFPGADVERDARFRHARTRRPRRGAREIAGARRSWACRMSVSTTTGSATISRRQISTASARLAWNPDLIVAARSPTNGRGSPSAPIRKWSQRIGIDAAHLAGARMKTTPARSGCKRSPISPAITTA